MLARALVLAIVCAVLLSVSSRMSSAQVMTRLSLWVPDALAKVLPDTEAPDGAETVIRMQAARGEFESAQFAVRSDDDLAGLRLEVSALESPDGDVLPEGALTAGFVGYVPLEKNTYNTPEAELIATAPCEIPDPILADDSVDVAANRTQPVWVTVHVPVDAKPGTYTATVVAKSTGGEAAVAVELTVWPFELPQERHLQYTNWVNAGAIAKPRASIARPCYG